MKGMFAAVLLTALLTTTARAEEPTDVSLVSEVDQYLSESNAEAWNKPETLRAFWSSGLRFESNDGNFKLKIGGRLMFDNIWRQSDEFGPNVTTDSSFFRRVRLFMSGEIHKLFGFKLQVDFAKGTVVLKDVWGSIKVKWLGGATDQGRSFQGGLFAPGIDQQQIHPAHRALCDHDVCAEPQQRNPDLACALKKTHHGRARVVPHRR